MSKETKKKILLGLYSPKRKLPLMAHWNNDSGCRL